ncbi:MAG TPA: CarD family transcriptional regulator, partial [Rhabdochlamydiaceae bacterium]|nr:CarD family transcriptional regulator [Rhabdochlamydiaceae bacterium]
MTNLLKSAQLALFREAIQKEPSLLIEGLWDSPKAALLSIALRATGKNILVVTGEKRENRIIDDLDYFELKFLDFPSWEMLPGEEIPPSPDIVGKRFLILSHLLFEKLPQLIFCPLQALLQKIPSPKTLKPLYKTWKVGDELAFDSAAHILTSLGYRREKVASDKGEFALRQGIIDLFPLSSFDPVRIEFFGDTIDTIRTYEPTSQKSITKVDHVFIVPASESNLLKKEENLSTVLDFLGENTLVVFDDLLALEDRYVAFKGMPGAKSRFFGTMKELMHQMKRLQCMLWSGERMEELSETHLPKKKGRDFYSGKDPLQPIDFHIFDEKITSKRLSHPFREISDYFSPSVDLTASSPEEILQGINRFSKTPLELHILCSTESEEKALKVRLEEEQISLPKNHFFERAYLSNGFALVDAQFAILPMTELTGRFRIRRQKWRTTYHSPLAEFHDLSPGDLVVHFHNGIGKYLGIEKKPNHLGQQSEFMAIEYAEGSKLYVPISSSYLVSRYIGAKEEVPTLTQLGTKRWLRARLDTQKAIIGYARDLLHMSAEREIHGGFQFRPDSDMVQMFEFEFPFVETEDQLSALDAIKKDMLSGKVMDRLICGDVGYGKTEVAMRAAFKAVVDGKKQV